MSTEIGMVAGIQVGTFVGPVSESIDRLRVALYSHKTNGPISLTREQTRDLVRLLCHAIGDDYP